MKRKTLHYPFCEDLGNKKIIDIIWPEKINFALFNMVQTMSLSSSKNIPDTDVILPGAYSVEKVSDWTEWQHKEYQAFIAPSDYYNDGNLFYVREKQLKIDIKEEFLKLWKEKPHLIEHATFQFYFLNENLFSANLPFLRINDNNQIEVDWKIKAGPTGTFLFFRSGHIFFKWKIEVRQQIISMNLLKETWTAINNATKKVGSVLLKTFTLGTVDVSGKEADDLKNLAGDLTSGKDAWEKTGLGKERGAKVQEQHTERLFKSTYADLTNNTIEPSILYSNTITFPYNLFDYFLRAEKDPFFCRIYYSNNLFNNLKHNNNSNPVTFPLNITFPKLAMILRKGYYQGSLKLAHDPEGFMSWKFKEGVTFFEDMEKDFPKPDLGVTEIPDMVKYSSGDGDNYISEEIREPGSEPTIAEVNRRKGSDYWQRAHYFIFYEDGTTDHWGCKMPKTNYAAALSDGHTQGGFILEFSKPVKKFIDVYTCIGCGASNQGYDATGITNYDNATGDSLDNLLKGLPFEPWRSEFTGATLQGNHWKCPNGKLLGGQMHVWEQATIEKAGVPFTKAYGFIPGGETITWKLSTLGKTRIVLQKVPGNNDFDNLDWTPPLGAGGDIEIPLTEPDIPDMEPDADVNPPEPDPSPDLFDPTGGEPEITIEPDVPDVEPDLPEPDFPEPDIPEPEITPDIPEPDFPDPDPTDPDTGETDVPDFGVPEFDPSDYE